MNFTKVISTNLDNLSRRVIKILRLGKSDVRTALEATPYGIDSNPVKDMIAIYSPLGTKGKKVIIGYLNKNQLAEVGGLRLYSTDENGSEQNFVYLRSSGDIEIGGDTDNMVRFSKLKEAFDELKNDFNNFVSTTYATHTHNVISIGAPTAVPVPLGTTSAADIDPAKIDEIKTS